MTDKNMKPIVRAEAHQPAAELLRKKRSTSELPRAAEDPLRLLHELQVHQNEVEMQTDALCRPRSDVETVLARYADLYDFAPAGYFCLDPQGIILSVNLTGAALLGGERSDIIGRRFEDFVVNEERPACACFLERVCAAQAKDSCEVALLKEGISPFFVHIEAVAAASGQECRLLLIDIDERKRTAEAFREEKKIADALWLAKKAVEASDLAKSRFLGNLSHELRTPMTGILGMLQLTLDEDIAPVLRAYLESAFNEARSLLRIMNEILDMAKIQTGKLTLVAEAFSVASCLDEAVDHVIAEARRKGLDFSLSVADEAQNTVVGDRMRLRQVSINLIGNAVKFTEEGKVAVRVSAGAVKPDGTREFTIAVADTGIGIPDDKKELLFRPFSQVDDSPTRCHGGSGLGLAASRGIVELMGGTIGFESKAEVGSTFTFTVPLRVAKCAGARVPAPACKSYD